MKKKAKPASKKPLKIAKPLAAKRAPKPARRRPIPVRTPAEETANRDVLAAGFAQLLTISADMRELLAEIRDLLTEGAREEAEEEAGEEGGTVVIAEGEDFE
jgi:hypothetical protein